VKFAIANLGGVPKTKQHIHMLSECESTKAKLRVRLGDITPLTPFFWIYLRLTFFFLLQIFQSFLFSTDRCSLVLDEFQNSYRLYLLTVISPPPLTNKQALSHLSPCLQPTVWGRKPNGRYDTLSFQHFYLYIDANASIQAYSSQYQIIPRFCSVFLWTFPTSRLA